MSLVKKKELEKILHSVSKPDWFVHKKETALIATILSSIGILNISNNR